MRTEDLWCDEKVFSEEVKAGLQSAGVAIPGYGNRIEQACIVKGRTDLAAQVGDCITRYIAAQKQAAHQEKQMLRESADDRKDNNPWFFD